ncbi:MAG: hypothetical protein H0V79_11760 [Actinobacteria bacterium]|nr:hypothetical protein [Actinomycetota bacterium]
MGPACIVEHVGREAGLVIGAHQPDGVLRESDVEERLVSLPLHNSGAAIGGPTGLAEQPDTPGVLLQLVRHVLEKDL